MLEVLLLMLSVAANTAGNYSGGGRETAALPVFPAPAEQPADAVKGDSAAATSQAAAAPVFLAPKEESAAPATAAAAPVFLAPAAKPGPVAEPQVPTGLFTTAVEVKPILDATRESWILVREFDGKDLLYVTQIWAWRCGLLEMKVGINGHEPEVWPMPECHMDQPSPAVILEGDGQPYREFDLGSIALIEVELTYDDLTKDRVKFNRQGKIVP